MRRALASLWLTMDFYGFLALIISRADWAERFQASQIIPCIKCRNDTTRKVSNCWIELEMWTSCGGHRIWVQLVLIAGICIDIYICIHCFSLGCIPAVMDDSAMFSGFSMHFKAWLRVYLKNVEKNPGRPGSSWTLQENWCIQRVPWLHPFVKVPGIHRAAIGDPHRTVPGAFGIEQFMLLSWRWLSSLAEWRGTILDPGCFHGLPYVSMVHIGSPFRQGKTCNIGWVRVGQPWRLCSEGIAWRKSGMGGYEGSDVLQPASATCIHST